MSPEDSDSFGWKRFVEADEQTHPSDDMDYTIIDNNGMMQVLAGRLNYFIRAGVEWYCQLPSLPDAVEDDFN